MYYITNQINTTFILFLLSVVIFMAVFKWIHYLIINNFINFNINKESFDTKINETEDNITHTVDLPFMSKYNCSNFCGPKGTCIKTGEQCFTDDDCNGCKPPVVINQTSTIIDTIDVNGQNDAGKLTVGVTPQYSELTTDIGTQAKIYSKDKLLKPAIANFGPNIWRSDFNETQKIFDQRYKPPVLQYMPDYPPRVSLSGNFVDEGPLASNAFL